VFEIRNLKIAPSAVVKEKRLAALLAGRSPEDPMLRETVADAQLLGSLELAGFGLSWSDVREQDASLAHPEVIALRRAQRAVKPAAPVSVAAIRAWHAAAIGDDPFRTAERAPLGPEQPPPAPPRFIESRLALLEQWLGAGSADELKPPEMATLVLTRIVEILPFADGNGRVARLAASHVMVRGGLRPPILVGGDRPRLEACLSAAFRLDTAPLTQLLREASERAVDVMMQSLDPKFAR
jgi:Fic family protein